MSQHANRLYLPTGLRCLANRGSFGYHTKNIEVTKKPLSVRSIHKHHAQLANRLCKRAFLIQGERANISPDVEKIAKLYWLA